MLAVFVERAERLFVIRASQAEPAPVIRKIEFFKATGPFESNSARCRSREPSRQKYPSEPAHSLQIFQDPGGTFSEINMLICYVDASNE